MRLGVFVGSSRLVSERAPLALPEPQHGLDTPWGEAAALPVTYAVGDHELVLLPRHGAEHHLAPHQINYRANVWLMHKLGVDCVLGTYTVGGIAAQLSVGDLVVPHQLIDYTWGRQSSFDDELRHIDFSYPFDVAMRRRLLTVAPHIVGEGVYACSQGPRLETAAEIRRMARDGCTVVGMTGMPEAALCRELQMTFAALCLVVNPAAGVGDDAGDAMLSEAPIDMTDLFAASRLGAAKMLQIIEQYLISVE